MHRVPRAHSAQSDEHLLEDARLGRDVTPRRVDGLVGVVLHLCGDVLAVELDGVEKGEDLAKCRVLEQDHVLRQRVRQREEGALRVEPRVRLELLVVGLQGLDDPGDPELEVALRAVERSDDQVDDAQVEDLGSR